MPLKFVGHRWLENIAVCDRAITVWRNVEVYVKAVHEKKIPKPENKSFATIKEAVEDPLITAKLHFFRCVANQLQPFLVNYQTEKPMVCFLNKDLCDVIRGLMRRFVMAFVLGEATTNEKLVKIDIKEKSHHVLYKDVDVGFSAEKALADAIKHGEKGQKKVSERMVMEFREESKKFLVAVLQKLLQKCPVTYTLVRNMAALNPQQMQENPELCRKMFKQVLTVLVSAKRVKECDCDEVLQQYANFLDNISVTGSVKFSSFDSNKERVDEFFTTYMSGTEYSKLHAVMQLLLVLSHGQAAVERGCSVNKEVEVENLKSQSLIAQRIICDHVSTVGGVLNVDISQKLLQSASLARQKYEKYLTDEREKRKTEQEQRKRKGTLEVLGELTEKRKKIKLDIESLLKSADELSEQAERTRNMTFVTKSNSFRRTAKEKQEQLVDVEKKIAEQRDVLKEC